MIAVVSVLPELSDRGSYARIERLKKFGGVADHENR